MSLSKSQKARRYGSNTQAELKDPRPQRLTPHKPQAGSTYSRDDLAADPQKNSSYVFAAAAFAVAVLLFLYYHLWLLPQLSKQAGLAVPELLFWFDGQYIAQLKQGLGPDLMRQYQSIHRSSGLIFPLIFIPAWLGTISAAGLTPGYARLLKLLGILYGLIFLAGGFVLDLALANSQGPVGLAAFLILLRWLLLLLCLLTLVILTVRLFKIKFAAFARGDLPGQQGQ